MKTILITGASAGIGLATARLLAGFPDCCILLACRNLSKTRTAMNSIRQAHPGAQVEFVPLDLFSLASVRRVPEVLSGMTIPPLKGLILNAGGIDMKAKSLEFSEDGFERTFQLNFLGHFLLANLLVEQMAAPGRIVFVSSDLHDPAATKMGKLLPPRSGPVADLARASGTAARLKPMARYGTAKLYAMMAAYELGRRLRESGRQITVNSWSPGVVPTTEAGRGMNPIMKLIMTSHWFVEFMGSHLSTENEAAKALGALALDEKYERITGRYFDGFREIPSSVESRDKEKAKVVWQQSARLAGIESGPGQLGRSRSALLPASE